MRPRISPAAAKAAAFAAAVTRVFCALTLEDASLHNGAWLCALLGGALAAPTLCALAHLRRGMASWRVSGMILLPGSLLSAASALGMLGHSASFLALDRLHTALLLLPLVPLVLRGLWLNGDAVGASARVWLKAFPWMLLLLLAVQFRYFRLDWLFPLLGNGGSCIIRGALRAAAGFTGCLSLLFFAEEAIDARETLRIHLAAVISVAALLAIHLMLMPASAAPLTRIERLDGLLTNGRVPVSLQLPMAITWFIPLIVLANVETLRCALILSHCARLNGPAAIIAATLGAFFLALMGVSEGIVGLEYDLIIAFVAVEGAIRKGAWRKCAQSG